MDKRGDVPYWLGMLLLVLVGLIVMLVIIASAGDKLKGIIDWIGGIF